MNTLRTFTLYSLENRFFVMTFLLSIIPLWVPVLLAATEKINVVTALLLMILVAAARSLRFSVVSGGDFFKIFVNYSFINPMKISFYALTGYIVVLLVVMMGLHGDVVDVALCAALGICLIIYMLWFMHETEEQIWLKGDNENWAEKFVYYVLINGLWLYLAIAPGAEVMKYLCIFSVVFLEVRRFFNKHEGLF